MLGIDVAPIYGSPELVHNSQTIKHCRIDSVTTRRNVVVNPSYLGIIPYYVAASRTGPVITRTMSPWSTGGTERARTIGELCARTVRQSID